MTGSASSTAISRKGGGPLRFFSMISRGMGMSVIFYAQLSFQRETVLAQIHLEFPRQAVDLASTGLRRRLALRRALRPG